MGKLRNEDIFIQLEESVRDNTLDRKIQSPMFTQPQLRKWAVYVSKKDREVCNKFLSTLQECISSFSYPMQKPKIVFVEGNSIDDWINEFRILDSSVQMVILVLKGSKKAAPYYKDLKHNLILKGIPSQVILAKTLSGNRIKSIVFKLLIQICAKVGGIPW